MHTSNIIYQSAVAHQTDLRRQASARSRADRPRSMRPSWTDRFSSVLARRTRVTTAAKPVAGSVVSGRLSS
jgi:hypothetical protein